MGRFVLGIMKDVLIVGFGLAGLSIAAHAEDNNLSLKIISNKSQMSSKIAGGILNPIAVKRMKPVWKVEEFLPYAKSYYMLLESRYGSKFYHSKLIKVAIHNIEQENNWYQSYDKLRVQPHIQKLLETNTDVNIKIKRLGSIKAGVVDLKLLFQSSRDYHSKKKMWIEDTFKYTNLKFINGNIEYNNEIYKHLIFCEGFGTTINPFFKDLGIYGNKGDYLIIESSQLKYNHLLKSKYFLIPLGNNLYKYGATYQRSPLNHQPSEEAKSQMVEALNKMISSPYKVVDQLCGIRPTTKDRKPILGTHKNYKNIHILNGFGSRGVMTSPLLGKNLIEHIFEGTPLDKEVSIDRIYART